MKITTEKYAIVTKGFPLTFIDDCGCKCDSIEDDVLFETKEEAEDQLNCFDKPSEYQVIPIKITYEI